MVSTLALMIKCSMNMNFCLQYLYKILLPILYMKDLKKLLAKQDTMMFWKMQLKEK